MKPAGMKKASYSSPLYDALYVATSRIVGRGLFTSVAIRRRAKIGELEGEVVSRAEARRRAAGRRVIAIVETARGAIDASRTRRGFRFVNHSCAPNTFIRILGDHVEFYALRDIAPGEELTADYGETHHEGQLPCRCGADRCRGRI